MRTQKRRPGRFLVAAVAVALVSSVIGAVPTMGAAQAAEVDSGGWEVVAPTTAGGPSPSAVVGLDEKGTLAFSARLHGRTVLRPSPIGIRTTEGDFTSGLHLVGLKQPRTVVENYTMLVGKQLTRHKRMSEQRFEFANAHGARMNLVVRAAADGVAYRYVLPAGENGVTVVEEASSYQLPAAAPAWLQNWSGNYENFFTNTTAGEASTSNTGIAYPSLFEVDDAYVLISESDISGRYSGTRLRHVSAGSGRFKVTLALANGQETPIHHGADLTTPWRVAIIGDLATVVESTLVDDLAPPSRVAGTSWIKPGVSGWSWLVEHSSPRDLERQKDFVDYAGEQNWPYYLVDEGWSASWVPELAEYAAERGVKLQLWFRWTELQTDAQRDMWLPLVKSWGVESVKIDFMDSDAQARYEWYDDILAATAEHQLMVNFHGAQVPRGQQRTWPHLMTSEGVRGGEYYTFNIAGRPTAQHNTNLVFTRNVVGSMDYTPATFSPPFRQGITSDAHEVALPVLYESGLQHLADNPETYRKYPVAEWFFRQLPTVWDETKLLGGYPGQEAVMAKRDGNRWFIGGISSGAPRTLKAPLHFLPGNSPWLVELVRDSGDGLVIERQIMSGSGTLEVDVPSHGGFAAVVCGWNATVTTCS